VNAALLFFGLLWSLLGRSRTTPEQAPRTRPRAAPPAPAPAKASTPPWPAVVPATLPAFPGSGWEPDEPPPKTVQQRAGELVTPLWKQGQGSSKIEQTAGRWIAYRAAITAGGKHGVIAYRVKRSTVPARPTAAPPAAKPPDMLRPPAGGAGGWPGRPPGSIRVSVEPGTDIEQGPLPSSLTPLPVLRRGDGISPHAPVQEVRLLQNYLHIPVDGRFGGDTDKAVRAFQKAHSLTVDGIVGKATWAALFTPPRYGATGTWA
jgi:peptidoglycan hydrolase-like protein with peptidoglycan-binding domain